MDMNITIFDQYQDGILKQKISLTKENDDKKVRFLRNVCDILVEEGWRKGTDVNSKVIEFLHPEELSERLDLSLTDHGSPDDQLLELCKETIKYSVKTGHPHFFNQLFAGICHYGLAASWITDVTNTSQYTYEMAPVYTVMEKSVIDHMAKFVGYKEGWDGIFCPGGSVSNMYGMNLARHHAFPEAKQVGMSALPPLCVLASEQSHFSVMKSASFLGIGTDNVIGIQCDQAGKMIPQILEKEIQKAMQQGMVPFMVHATGGTTVRGAYDPLEEIADICERYGVWLHADIIWGGGALLSSKYRHLCRGVDRADSVAWNPHKLMGVPQQCCAFLTKHTNMLRDCHGSNAKYLYQQDKFYDVEWDAGDKSIQCGRRVDVFKVWLMWKAKGDNGFEACIDRIFGNARYLAERVRLTEGFKMTFQQVECTNVCFWYIPLCLRGLPETEEWYHRLGKAAPIIKKRMMEQGTTMINYQPLGDKVNFFRMVVINPITTEKDMDWLIGEIDRLGRDIAV